MLEFVDDDNTASRKDGFRDDASAAAGADAPEAVRSTAHAGSETGPEQSVQAGPLSRLFLKISTDPIETLQALEELSALIGERALREVRAFRREVEIRLDAMETRLDAMETRSKAWRDVQDAKIDALHKLYEGLEKQMRLLVVLFAFQFFFLGALATISLMDWFGTDKTSASTPSLELQAPANAEESASALGGPPPASALASEHSERPGVDTVEETQPIHPPGR